MATKKSAENGMETEVILVVKGAGEQAEDDHLNLFLRGFWPAIKSLDKEAAIAQVTDPLKDYEPSPHNQDGNLHKHLTEIRAKLPDDEKHKYSRKRIWIKESYWEAETLSSSALGNLFKEWRMSSFVFANMFQDIFFTRDTKDLKRLRTEKEKNRKKSRLEAASGTQPRDYAGNYISHILLFILVFLPFLTTSASNTWFKETLDKFLAATLIPGSGFNEFMLVLVAAAIWALAPAFEIATAMHQYREKQEGSLKKLPGLPGWVLVAMIFLLVNDPIGYLRFVLFLLVLQITLILSRRILWQYRIFANSDVDIAEYYSYEISSGSAGQKDRERIGKVDESWLTRLPFSPLLYRYVIFLTLPIAFAGTILVKILKWTRIFGGLADTLDDVLKTALVGYMDDVVNYAMDPAQSHRVRSAIMDDIIYFYEKHPEVQRIHIIAHSQGTPITYETLFHFLKPEYQDKIYTYVTLGSVLSYYNQARGVLDEIYHERFPVPPTKTQYFARDFKWVNFWNFTDPITEFYGLDEYTSFSKIASKKDNPKDKDQRSNTCPVNIRTRSSLLKNHGEYWSNIDQINKPLAKRVLGVPKPEEWTNQLQTNSKKWHHWGVLIVWILITAFVGFGGYWLVTSGKMDFIFNYFTTLINSGLAVFNIYNPQETNEPSLANRALINNFWRQILDGSLVVLAIWIVIDWVSQLGRAITIRRK